MPVTVGEKALLLFLVGCVKGAIEFLLSSETLITICLLSFLKP